MARHERKKVARQGGRHRLRPEAGAGWAAQDPRTSHACINGGASVAFEADASNAHTVNAGTCTVVEDAEAGYATSYDNCTNLQIPNGGTATCTITNDDQPPPSVCLPDKIYAVDDPGGLGSEFFNVDPVSKVVSACGQPYEDGDFESLESKNGVLYTISAEGQSPWIAGGFYRLSSTCGLTYVGQTRYRDLEGLAVRITDGTMWAVVGNDTGIQPKGSLVTINDVTTGVATLASRILYADTGISEAIEGMDVDHVKSQQLGVDVLILGPHNKSTMYYWNVSTKQVIGTLSTGRFDDIEGIATCRIN